MNNMATTEEMLAGVKKHAFDNYGKGGWDYVVECYEDSDILEIINEDHCTTVEDAIKAVAEICGVHEERRFEAQAASGELEHYGIVEHEGRLVRKSELEEV